MRCFLSKIQPINYDLCPVTRVLLHNLKKPKAVFVTMEPQFFFQFLMNCLICDWKLFGVGYGQRLGRRNGLKLEAVSKTMYLP